MDHSDPVPDTVDRIVYVRLGQCSQPFLRFCIIEQDFSIAEQHYVIVVMAHILDCARLHIFPHIISGICHAACLGIVELRIGVYPRVRALEVTALPSCPWSARSKDGLRHTRIPVLEHIFIRCCSGRVPYFTVGCQIRLYHAVCRHEPGIVIRDPAFP